MISIYKKLIYSTLVVAFVFSSMILFDIYQKNSLVTKYQTVTLKKFKYDEYQNDIFSNQKRKGAKIHISGAVKNPGFFEVTPGIKLDKVIKKVVILRAGADLDKINLNKKLYNKDQIIIPHQNH